VSFIVAGHLNESENPVEKKFQYKNPDFSLKCDERDSQFYNCNVCNGLEN